MIIDQKIYGIILKKGTNVFSFPEKYNLISEMRVSVKTNRIVTDPTLRNNVEFFIDGEKIISTDSALFYVPKIPKKNPNERFTVFTLNVQNKRQDFTIINNAENELYVEFLLYTVNSPIANNPVSKYISVPVFDAVVNATTTKRVHIDLNNFDSIKTYCFYSLYSGVYDRQTNVVITLTIGLQKPIYRLKADGIIMQSHFQNLENIPYDVDLRYNKYADTEITADTTTTPILILLKGK